jgi:predicted RNA-binding Zn-ribbon protein involved in translation (DUF1610 family)
VTSTDPDDEHALPQDGDELMVCTTCRENVVAQLASFRCPSS